VILVAGSGTDAVRQDVIAIKTSTETVINDIAVVEAVIGNPPRNFVLADDSGDVRITSQGSRIREVFSLNGVLSGIPKIKPRTAKTLGVTPLADEPEEEFM